MYPWITHTWNTVKGACPHGCTYCYMRRFGEQKPTRFDAKELKTDLGAGNFIFVGSSCDMWAAEIRNSWISDTLAKCREAGLNAYLFQSKNPARIEAWEGALPAGSIVCTTIETNRIFACMARSPSPSARALGMERLYSYRRFVTIEPILDFDLAPLVELVRRCEPEQVNIGADSGGNHLPEPPAAKVLALIEELSKFTTIARKSNLGRLLGDA